MSRLSPSSIAVLSGAALILGGSLYWALAGGPSADRPVLSENEDGALTTSLPAGFLDGIEPAPPQLDLTLDPAPINPSDPFSLGDLTAPRAAGVSKNDFPTSAVRIELAPQRFSDDEIVVRPYVGMSVDVDGAGAEGSFLGAEGLAADFNGTAEIGSRIAITKSLEIQLGYEIQETLGSTGGTTSGLNHQPEERVQGGLSLKF